jgi:DNA-binding response OmpR family regulator
VTGKNGAVVMGVDDDPSVLDVMNLVLTRAGYRFVPSPSGEDCLLRVHHADPKLILLDVQLRGGINGFDTCRELRADTALRDIPIVFVTARKTTEDVRTGILVGGNDFVVKPFDRKRLLARVQHWLSRPLRSPNQPA